MPRSDVRPTSERARQAFFNILGDRIDGARFLDLFAGSGIFAFEAVSRGAAEALAVDSSRYATAAIEKTAQTLQVPLKAATGDALTALKRLKSRPFEIVYADPPYDYAHYGELAVAIGELDLPAEAVVAIEHRRNSDPFAAETPRLQIERRAEYGEVWMTFFTPATG